MAEYIFIIIIIRRIGILIIDFIFIAKYSDTLHSYMIKSANMFKKVGI